MKFEKMKKLRCENVKINKVIVIFTELFKVHLTIYHVYTVSNNRRCSTFPGSKNEVLLYV